MEQRRLPAATCSSRRITSAESGCPPSCFAASYSCGWGGGPAGAQQPLGGVVGRMPGIGHCHQVPAALLPSTRFPLFVAAPASLASQHMAKHQPGRASCEPAWQHRCPGWQLQCQAGAHPQVLLHHGAQGDIRQEAAAGGDAQLLLRLRGGAALVRQLKGAQACAGGIAKLCACTGGRASPGCPPGAQNSAARTSAAARLSASIEAAQSRPSRASLAQYSSYRWRSCTAWARVHPMASCSGQQGTGGWVRGSGLACVQRQRWGGARGDARVCPGRLAYKARQDNGW